MPRLDIMSMIGSAVPEPLRVSGHLACWYVLVDGERCLGPFVSPAQARAARQRFALSLGLH